LLHWRLPLSNSLLSSVSCHPPSALCYTVASEPFPSLANLTLSHPSPLSLSLLCPPHTRFLTGFQFPMEKVLGTFPVLPPTLSTLLSSLPRTCCLLRLCSESHWPHSPVLLDSTVAPLLFYELSLAFMPCSLFPGLFLLRWLFLAPSWCWPSLALSLMGLLRMLCGLQPWPHSHWLLGFWVGLGPSSLLLFSVPNLSWVLYLVFLRT
jgi:hypothetical protein